MCRVATATLARSGNAMTVASRDQFIPRKMMSKLMSNNEIVINKGEFLVRWGDWFAKLRLNVNMRRSPRGIVYAHGMLESRSRPYSRIFYFLPDSVAPFMLRHDQ